LSKAYSSKALPPGTIIREWRLEDVLGVGGFGIVYKGRGIYFGELVAIKEYFPSSIAERDAESTVVPIGSDVEEVHALGLKKFVEEAKLLWNLSTPSRHPNIVSVRSLFQIHGTAYMVMDFEDGVSLSKLLREGRRFNERSLWNIVKPIAEGLDRAHRVGVLHRDIKPPNILITEDNRPVLIDFGSARFEAAEATSTTVTFHTPPYAAVEQYVKTYAQGPWTDIYALAVVLYECVTGEKPPEVLERLHGGMGTPLSDGHWPGFTKKFLQAIDAGMTIRPTERPQSIREWLAMFGKKDDSAPVGGDDEPTRFFAHEVASEEIVPVASLAPGFDKKETLETGVPSDPSEAQFKQAGQETKTSKKKKAAVAEVAAEAGEPQEASDESGDEAAPVIAEAKVAPASKAPPKKADPFKESAEPWYKKQRAAVLAGGGAIAALVAVAGGFLLTGKGGDRRLVRLGPWRWVLLGYCLLVTSLSFFMPILVVLQAAFARAWGRGFSWDNVTTRNLRFVLLEQTATRAATLNTFVYAAAATRDEGIVLGGGEDGVFAAGGDHRSAGDRASRARWLPGNRPAHRFPAGDEARHDGAAARAPAGVHPRGLPHRQLRAARTGGRHDSARSLQSRHRDRNSRDAA